MALESILLSHWCCLEVPDDPMDMTLPFWFDGGWTREPQEMQNFEYGLLLEPHLRQQIGAAFLFG